MERFFENIDYLAKGNARQQLAYKVLTKYRVMDVLSIYCPVLAGTIPIGIDIDSSDLDIICCWKRKQEFIADLKLNFEHTDGFRLYTAIHEGTETVIANFFIDGFEIEIFGQPVPVQKQRAYMHMVVEYKILQEKGEAFRQQIVKLKKEGLKTEPAFARLLGLQGNPYEELLKFY